MRFRSVLVPLLVTGLSLTLGCREQSPRMADGPREPLPPAPPFSSIDSASHAEIIKYAASLPYEGWTGSSDRQALALSKFPGGKCPQDCAYGPVARIEPQPAAIAWSDEDLKVGRVLGRIINEDDAVYEKLNLGPKDTVYAWVELRNGEYQGRLISSDPKRLEASRKVRKVTNPDGPHPPLKQAVARWIWSADDEQAWYSCPKGCCVFTP